MSFRYSPANLLAAATPTSPAQVAGYSATAVVDGQIGVLSRSASATTFTFKFDRGVSPPTAILLVAVFGLKSTVLGSGNIASVNALHSTDDITYSGHLIAPNSRGDGYYAVACGTDRYVKLVVTLTLADTLDLGEIWGGNSTDLTRSPMGPLERGLTYPVRVNDGSDGSIFTSQVADYVEDWAFSWGTLTASQANEVLAMFQAVSGQLLPILLVPDTIGGEVFLGHWTGARLPRRVDTPAVSGLQLPFRQLGRALYA